jgi:hypothetical protein
VTMSANMIQNKIMAQPNIDSFLRLGNNDFMAATC